MGIKRELVEEEIRIERGGEGIMIGNVKVGKEQWRIIGVYVGGDIQEILRELEKWGEEKDEGRKILMRGDFNARRGGRRSGNRMGGE